MRRNRKILFGLIVVMAMICTQLIFYDVNYSMEVAVPTMDVWFENAGESTYINFFDLKEGVKYYVSLFDGTGVVIDDKIPWADVTMPMDDFTERFEPGYRILLEEQLPDNSLVPVIDYIIPDIAVDIVNINTEVVTGTSNGVLPIQVVVFERVEESFTEYSVYADIVDGVYNANFTGVYDINPLSDGLIIQPDANGNKTITNWWAPNPELMVNPMLDTVGGFGWLGDVTIVIDEGLPTEQRFTIDVDSEFGSFENVPLGIDLYGGMTIKAYDWMTVRMMTVSTLTIEWFDLDREQVMMAAEPNAYVQFVVMEGIFPDVEFPIFTDSMTDETGHHLFDFSTEPNYYDLTTSSWGFTRSYDGHGNATLYEWRASDYLVLLGDVDENGLVDKNDLKLLTRYIAGKTELTATQLRNADVNQDSVVDVKDIKALQLVLHVK